MALGRTSSRRPGHDCDDGAGDLRPDRERQERGTAEQKQAAEAEREAARAQQLAAQQARGQAELEHVRNLPGWEYKVIRVSDRRQSGMAGADQMESQFNQLGGRGWELVAVSQERTIFKWPALRDPAGPQR